MSGVYIPGMKMPQRDEVITVYPDGTAHRHHLRLRLHISESKAVPIPEHGRLIDANALMENAQYKGTHDILTAWDVVAAPTIIPADKEAGE